MLLLLAINRPLGASEKETRPVPDAAFCRMVTLDVIGLLPEPARLSTFLKDSRNDKRSLYVSELLSNNTAYTEHWLTFWNDLLRNDYGGTGFITDGRKQISPWLYESLMVNKPYDAFVRELINPSEGSMGFSEGIQWRGISSASQSKEIQFAQSVSQAFLGINLKCASCHDSFSDHWKLQDTYGLAAVFAKTPIEIYRCDRPTGEMAEPAWIFPDKGRIDPKTPQPERLRQLSDILTQKDNHYFSRTISNRIWHQLMGTWLISPEGEEKEREDSQETLRLLEVKLIASNYDLKQIIRWICESKQYQSPTVPDLDPEAKVSPTKTWKKRPKRFTAEQFMDAAGQITGEAPTRFDAPILRGDHKPGLEEKEHLKGRWIWGASDSEKAMPNEVFTARKQFTLKQIPLRAAGVITADDAFVLYLNGNKICYSEAIERIQAFKLTNSLKAGTNELLIVARNGGLEPNPAGVIFDLRIFHADGSEESISSDETWEWTTQVPDSNGRFQHTPTVWNSAKRVSNSSRWNAKYGKQLAMQFAQATNPDGRMVRASLLKSDTMQRTLGRPNREQITSGRPETFNTLEALELTTNREFAHVLHSGAIRLKSKFGNGRSGERDLIRHIFQFALSRNPTTKELAEAGKLLQQESGTDGVEDFLWAILMLPEFQYIH
jgi:hypothetical protein